MEAQSPGGASDTVGRVVAQKLGERLGQQVVSDNRPGATGNIGAELVAHATPDVLASHLPPELLSKVLAASLAAGSMTPERVLETVTPELLAKHLPHDVLWACIVAAAARAGVSTP